MGNQLGSYLVSLRPRTEHLHVSQGRTVLVTGRDGFINPESRDGLYVYQTRMLSRYVWKVNGETLRPVALSNVEQHNWLGYTLLPLPVWKASPMRAVGRWKTAPKERWKTWAQG